MILAGLDILISLEPLWPGRVDPIGLVFGLGLAVEKANIFPNNIYIVMLPNYLIKNNLDNYL
jgi:hypothetical protein